MTAETAHPARRWQSYVFTLTPIIFTVIVAGVEGVLYHYRCGPVRTVEVIFGKSTHQPVCRSITLAADLPSFLLGCSATTAAWLYWQGQLRWQEMARDLAQTKVLAADCGGLFSPSDRIERGLDWVVTSKPGRALILALVLLGGYFFYRITYHGAYFFRDYARGQHLHESAYTQIREQWWANWSHHPLLAVAWAAVGSAGVYSALRDLTAFVRRTRTIRRVRRDPAWKWVSSSNRVGHPWDALMRPANLRVWGLVTFLITLAVLIYLARAPQAGGARNIGLAVLAITVLAATGVPLRLYLKAVGDTYEGASTSAIDAASDHLAEADNFDEKTYYLLRRAEMSFGSTPPKLSAFTRVSKALVLVAAFVGFVASVYQVLGI